MGGVSVSHLPNWPASRILNLVMGHSVITSVVASQEFTKTQIVNLLQENLNLLVRQGCGVCIAGNFPTTSRAAS